MSKSGKKDPGSSHKVLCMLRTVLLWVSLLPSFPPLPQPSDTQEPYLLPEFTILPEVIYNSFLLRHIRLVEPRALPLPRGYCDEQKTPQREGPMTKHGVGGEDSCFRWGLMWDGSVMEC